MTNQSHKSYSYLNFSTKFYAYCGLQIFTVIFAPDSYAYTYAEISENIGAIGADNLTTFSPSVKRSAVVTHEVRGSSVILEQSLSDCTTYNPNCIYESDRLEHGETLIFPSQIQSFEPTIAIPRSNLASLESVKNDLTNGRFESELLLSQSIYNKSDWRSENVPQLAQADLNEDRFIGPTPTPTPVDPSPQPEFINPTDDFNNGRDGREVTVDTISVVGSSIFSDSDFAPIVEPLVAKTVTIEQLTDAADAITTLYLNQGYLTSRAILNLDSLAGGDIVFQVVEGQISTIDIEGADRLENYVRSRLELATETPLNINQLESQLRLLREDPRFENIEASLRAGSALGQSQLVVVVTEADPLIFNLGVDNYSPPSIGSERLSFSAAHLNLTGAGDRLSAAYVPRIDNIEGSYRLDFYYAVPLNAMDGTLDFRAMFQQDEVIDPPFADFDINAESEVYEVSYRQPLVRTPREEFALSLGFTYRDGQTFIGSEPFAFGFGPNLEGVTTTSVIRFGQDYTLRQVNGAWAFRSQLNLGVDWLDATENQGDAPDSQFFSWLGQIQRVQILNQDNFLIIELDLQLAANPLLASQQFVIGGGQSVRGYRQNVLAGDSGIRFSVEDRITVIRNAAGDSVLQLAPFVDLGAIWNHDDNPNEIVADNQFIIGVGLGLLWEPISGLFLRLDYAPPLIDLDNAAEDESLQDDGFHFSASFSF